MFSIIGRYLVSQTIRGLLLALSVVVVLIVLVDFVEQTRTVGTRADGLSPFDFVGLTLLKTPMLVETTLPFVLLFGVMATMFRLNRRSELTVMRASGISAWGFSAPAACIALGLGVLSPVLLNPVATQLNEQFEQRRAELTGGAPTGDQGVSWFRERGPSQQRVIRAEGVDPFALTLTRPTFIAYVIAEDGTPEFVRRISADLATLDGDSWRLDGAVESAPGAPAAALGSIRMEAWLEAPALAQDGQADAISFWRLQEAAEAAEDVGVSPLPYELRWFRLLMSPILFASMALIAAAASMRLSRLGGALQIVVLAGTVGFLLYFVSDMLGALALTGRLPPVIAAAAAPAATVLIGMAVISKLEQG